MSEVPTFHLSNYRGFKIVKYSFGVAISLSLVKISALEPKAIEVLRKLGNVCSCLRLNSEQQITAKPLKGKSHVNKRWRRLSQYSWENFSVLLGILTIHIQCFVIRIFLSTTSYVNFFKKNSRLPAIPLDIVVKWTTLVQDPLGTQQQSKTWFSSFYHSQGAVECILQNYTIIVVF